MCFRIDMNAPRHEKRVVYKFFRVSVNGTLRSPYQPLRGGTWKLGKLRKIREYAVFKEFGVIDKAHEGFYVYTTRKSAVNIARTIDDDKAYAVVSVLVDPANLKYQSFADVKLNGALMVGRAATYSQITLKKVLAVIGAPNKVQRDGLRKNYGFKFPKKGK